MLLVNCVSGNDKEISQPNQVESNPEITDTSKVYCDCQEFIISLFEKHEKNNFKDLTLDNLQKKIDGDSNCLFINNYLRELGIHDEQSPDFDSNQKYLEWLERKDEITSNTNISQWISECSIMDQLQFLSNKWAKVEGDRRWENSETKKRMEQEEKEFYDKIDREWEESLKELENL